MSARSNKLPPFRLFTGTLLLVLRMLVVVFLLFILAFKWVYDRSADYLKTTALDEAGRAFANNTLDISTTFEHEWSLLFSQEFKQLAASFRDMKSDDTSFYANLLSAQKSIKNRFTTTEVFPNVMLLCMDADRSFLCSAKYISDDFQRDYDERLFRFGDLDYSQFIEMMTSVSDHRYTRRGLQVEPLYHSFNAGYSAVSCFFIYRYTPLSSDIQVYALLQMNVDQLKRSMSDFRYAGNYFSIKDSFQEVYSTEPDTRLPTVSNGSFRDASGNTLYLSTQIDRMGLDCRISLDEHEVYAGIESFSSMLSYLLYVFVFLVFALVSMLFLRWSYPIIRIAQHIHPQPLKGETTAALVTRIDEHINDLERQNASIEHMLEQLEPAAQRDLTRRFLQGEVLSEKELRIIEQTMSLPPEGVFRVLALGTLTPTGSPVLQQGIEAFKKRLPALVSCIDTEDLCVCLLPHASVSNEDCRTVLSEVLAVLNTSSFARYALGMSDAYVGYASATNAYREAVMGIIDARTWCNPSVVFGKDTRSNSSSYHFNYEQLKCLYSSLKSGSAEETLALYDQVVRENFDMQQGAHPRQMVCQQFYYDMIGMLVRLSMHHDVLPVLEPLLDKLPDGTISEQLATLRGALCDCLELIPQKDKDVDLAERIRVYLSERYCESTLSLKQIAAEFSIAESTLSHYFKARTGVSFSTYIENLRIHKAEQMLLNTTLSVREIAIQTGFGGTSTFYNAFRRAHNLTPSQWLDQQRS